ncbi:MAG TPA: methionine synthase [bacterium]|nr:methionine synthase [bacterium]
MLETTSVGSFPKPDYLVRARNAVSKGEASPESLRPLEEQATREWIRIQEDLGVDILVHGEMERGDMTTFFAEQLDGYGVSGLVRSYGNRYYRKPIIQERLARPHAMTVDFYRWTQSLTARPVKGMLTGPYTMCDWSFDEFYASRRDAVLALAEIVHQEVRDLEEAGARYIQIDEPAISTRPAEIDLAIEAMGIVTDGIRATTISHICYGDFARIYPRILDLPVDVLDLEFANSQFANLEIFRRPKFTRKISVGVIDVHSHRVESVREVKDAIKRALTVFDPEQVWIDPDCGLKTRTVPEAIDKLRVMVEATREVKRELGLA